MALVPSVSVLHCRDQVLEQPPRSSAEEGRGFFAWARYILLDRISRRRILLALAAYNKTGDLGEFRHRVSRVRNLNARLILGAYPHDTLLGWAVGQDNSAVARVALELGADPNLPSGSQAESPLCQAARNRNEPLAKLLAEFGGRWDARGLSYLLESIDSGLPQWLTAAWHAEQNGWSWAVAAAMEDLLGKRWEATVPARARPRL